jgi:hypothetical protein
MSSQAARQELRLHGAEAASVSRDDEAERVRGHLRDRLIAAGELGLAAEVEARRIQLSTAQTKRLLAAFVNAGFATYRRDTDRYVVTWKGLKRPPKKRPPKS